MSVKNSSMVKTKKYKLVPPDGGWGYMICISSIINFSTTTMFVGCFGILFDDFMKEIGMTSTNAILLTGINAMCVAISGFLTSPLLKLMSMRQLAFVAATIFNVGTFSMVFVKSVLLFFLCQGIMMGTGLGILYNLACTSLNDYFLTKRFFAFGLVQTITAINAMGAPMLTKWCLDYYGFRGTLLIITGIVLQNLVAVVIMQPVEWHMKRIEVPLESEMQLLLVEDKKEKSDVSTVKLTDVEATPIPEKTFDTPLDPNKKSGFRKTMESVFDVDVCKTILRSCVIVGLSLGLFADATYTLILPQALYSAGWSHDKVALAFSLMGFGDLATRTAFIFTGKWMNYIGSQQTYVIGLVIAVVCRLGMLWSESTNAILFYATIMGMAHCFVCVLIPMVLADVVSPEKFTAAMGIVLLFSGLTNLILGPAVGAVRDLTNSYSVAFYILTSLLAISALFWSIELIYKKNKHKRVRRSDSNKSSHSNPAK